MYNNKEQRSHTRDAMIRHGVPAGQDAVVLAEMAQEKGTVLHVALDDAHVSRLVDMVRFFAPEVEIIRFPAWDCLPYDRVSPHAEIVGERVAALCTLLTETDKPRLILTTVNAISQRVPPREVFQAASFACQTGDRVNLEELQKYLTANGYHRTETVREPGEFAVRGSLIDIYPSDFEHPVRLDLFGDELETIRSFDALSQRSLEQLESFVLRPVSEIFLNEESVQRFRHKYREEFGAVTDEDPLYEAISEGRKAAGMEHWLPLFYDELETLFHYVPEAAVTFDHQADQARDERAEQIVDFFASRLEMQNLGPKYQPVPVEQLFISEDEWRSLLSGYDTTSFSPFKGDAGEGEKGRDFSDVRAQPDVNVYAEVKKHIDGLGKRVLVAAYSDGARERLKNVLKEHGVSPIESVGSWETVQGLSGGTVGVAVLPLEHGFVNDTLAVITEQDILGDRLIRPTQKKRKAEEFIQEVSALGEGDYVVHEEHGIGQFMGLETLTVERAKHDCLKIIYAGDDKLFVPVENIEVLSRYGAEESGAQLDRLGGAGWQARKAKVKKDLMEMAEDLLKVAAARVLKKTEPMTLSEGLYHEFAARFPYHETEDQLRSINDVLEDLKTPQAMDRLVCGDVGFGKTEVALRAAYVAAMCGYQVAVVVPTTLLCRQHYQGFVERFKGMPVKIGQLSRLVSKKDVDLTKKEMADGSVNVVIGTHALLSESVKFANLGLLIVDEEQHFGVKQKEALKQLKENVHVLTLTATPIPRTLQLALTGVRELSLIATAPVDRLAVRTFVLPYDPLVVREALMREHFRGGQSFYVCPRIADLAQLEEQLKELVPELKCVVAHGQMTPAELEDRMTAFYDGKFDVLLSTNIIESGLDIPNANTMIIHRSEMFGLGQLYQLRGRIGRSKVRAYAYLTYETDKRLTKGAEQRLHVIEQLDTLGAGFQLASHDLDIRGAGNLLGEEQSGHIREVGAELYQQMLEEAVANAREGGGKEVLEERWSPHINVGTSVLIPEKYVKDLNLRLTLYRRIAELEEHADIESFAAELIDRFGPIPEEVENLLDIVAIKHLCRQAGVEKIEAGPKGATIQFRNNQFENVEGLIQLVQERAGALKLRPDQKLVVIAHWPMPAERVQGVQLVLKDLSGLFEKN